MFTHLEFFRDWIAQNTGQLRDGITNRITYGRIEFIKHLHNEMYKAEYLFKWNVFFIVVYKIRHIIIKI